MARLRRCGGGRQAGGWRGRSRDAGRSWLHQAGSAAMAWMGVGTPLMAANTSNGMLHWPKAGILRFQLFVPLLSAFGVLTNFTCEF